MAVLKSYQCQEHGYFDAWEQACPHCDAIPKQVFIKPFSIKSERTKSADRSLKGLAQDFKMTNIKSTREGEHQTGYLKRNNAPLSKQEQEFHAQHSKGKEAAEGGVMWGGNQNINMSQALSGALAKPVGPSIGREAESVGFAPPRNLTGPRADVIRNDHEGLTLKDAK
mgnify:CR=1 FL=1